MELTLNRKTRTNISTIGDLLINGTFQCYTLEDKDRGLLQTMSISELVALKIPGQTCIPAGRYEVIITFSTRFQKPMPLLVNVPAFDGIRIHPGNMAENTEGCLLLGNTKSTDFIGNSRVAWAAFFSILKAAVKTEKVFITIK